MNRRQFTGLVAAGTAGAAIPAQAHAVKKWQNKQSLWPLCLDTATIRPQSLEDKIRLAAKHGFDAIEPWEGEINKYEKAGGDLKELGKRIKDAGLFVPSVIGLWKALPSSDEKFENNLAACRNRMRQAQAIGAQHVQVIPEFDWPKVTPEGTLDRKKLSGYYKQILEIGLKEYDLQPAVVFLEFVHDLRTLKHAIEVARETGHKKAQIIPDTFHMHVGGSDIDRLGRIPGHAIGIFQFADAPAGIPREQLKDKDRVLPGDGILPLTDSLRRLHDINYTGAISLELYNPTYHQRDPDEFLKEAHAKTLAVVSSVG